MQRHHDPIVGDHLLVTPNELERIRRYTEGRARRRGIIADAYRALGLDDRFAGTPIYVGECPCPPGPIDHLVVHPDDADRLIRDGHTLVACDEGGNHYARAVTRDVVVIDGRRARLIRNAYVGPGEAYWLPPLDPAIDA